MPNFKSMSLKLLSYSGWVEAAPPPPPRHVCVYPKYPMWNRVKVDMEIFTKYQTVKTWEGMHCSVIEHGMASMSFQTAVQKNEAKLSSFVQFENEMAS